MAARRLQPNAAPPLTCQPLALLLPAAHSTAPPPASKAGARFWLRSCCPRLLGGNAGDAARLAFQIRAAGLAGRRGLAGVEAPAPLLTRAAPNLGSQAAWGHQLHCPAHLPAPALLGRQALQAPCADAAAAAASGSVAGLAGVGQAPPPPSQQHVRLLLQPSGGAFDAGASAAARVHADVAAAAAARLLQLSRPTPGPDPLACELFEVVSGHQLCRQPRLRLQPESESGLGRLQAAIAAA